jgi:hypothetical protein
MNTMVSNQDHVVPLDAFRAKNKSIPNHFSISLKLGVYKGVGPCHYSMFFQILGTLKVGVTAPLRTEAQ